MLSILGFPPVLEMFCSLSRYKPTGLMRSDGGGSGRLARFSFWLLRLQSELESFRFLDVHTSFIKYKQINASRSFIALQKIETARPPKLDENGF